MKILLIATSFNGLCQRIHRELTLKGHEISVELSVSDQAMIEAASLFNPDLIVCPFLKERIPDCVWEKYICLIVHPGIRGDKGPSSLDWAITDNCPEWGVTLLQADSCMDSGDIWGSQLFRMRPGTKASLYRNEVTAYAAILVLQAIQSLNTPDFYPKPLDYKDPSVRGVERPLMRQADRKINWSIDKTKAIVRKINAADSFPGLLDSELDEPVYLYGAREEQKLFGKPGELLAQCEGAVCKATVDGAIWIRMLKRNSGPEHLRIKLPATQVLQTIYKDKNKGRLSLRTIRDGCKDVWLRETDGIAYLYFDFYNGAMSTVQCKNLLKAYKSAKKRSNKVIVLMGGENFWSNGIHLNTIEAAKNPAKESWANIQAMDDLVLEIINSPKHITIAAVRNNAGAGGAILPLACDRVILRDGVVINPHYKTMGLYGSEYWTYLLPKRVGEAQARIIMRECLPVVAKEAILLGLADELYDQDWQNYHMALEAYVKEIAISKYFKELLAEKKITRTADEKVKRLKRYREEELLIMRQSFFDEGSEFHFRRYEFVHKICPQATPLHLAIHRTDENQIEGEEMRHLNEFSELIPANL